MNYYYITSLTYFNVHIFLYLSSKNHFILSPVSFWHVPILLSCFLIFFQAKTFQAHFVLFLTQPWIHYFSKMSSFIWGNKGIWKPNSCCIQTLRTPTYFFLPLCLCLCISLFVMYDASVLILIRIRKFQLKTTSFLLIMLQILFLTMKDMALICSVKGPSSQSYGFSSSHVWMWQLDHKESRVLKN